MRTLLIAVLGCAAALPAAAGTEQDIVVGANAFRRAQGLGELRPAPALDAAAAAFARYMASTDRYGHEADGRAPVQRVEAQGYDHCLVAENIAFEYRSTGFEAGELGPRFVRGWIDSPPHRANLLLADAVDTGVGVARSRRTGRWYAVQLFGRPQSMSVEFKLSNPTPRPARYVLDGERRDLPARTTMTHRECSAPTVSVAGAAAPAWRAENGVRYVLQPEGRGWRVTVAR